MPLPKIALFSPGDKVGWAAVVFDDSNWQQVEIEPPRQLDGVRGMEGSGWRHRGEARSGTALDQRERWMWIRPRHFARMA